MVTEVVEGRRLSWTETGRDSLKANGAGSWVRVMVPVVQGDGVPRMAAGEMIRSRLSRYSGRWRVVRLDSGPTVEVLATNVLVTGGA